MLDHNIVAISRKGYTGLITGIRRLTIGCFIVIPMLLVIGLWYEEQPDAALDTFYDMSYSSY